MSCSYSEERRSVMHGIVRKGLSVVLAMLMVIPSSFVVFADDTEDIAAEKQCGSSSQDAADYASENTSSENTEVEAPESTPVHETIESTGMQEEQTQSGTISAGTSTEEILDAAGTETGIDEPTDEDQALTEPEDATPESSEEVSEPADIASRKSPAPQGTETLGTAADKDITIAGTTLDGSSNGSGAGWSYDSSNNTIVLEGLKDKTDITANGDGVTIVTTGFSRIGTLSFNGQVDIIGTGIVLVDKIEISEYSALNLHSISEFYGEDGGSAALFLRQEDGSYKLINGGVTGVIDDEIILPEGTTLVMPEESSLRITSLFVNINYDEDGNPICKYMETGSDAWKKGEKYTDSALFNGSITVDNLVLERGAVITQIVDGLEVVKSLVNDGRITSAAHKGRIVDIDGDYSGNGILENSLIRLKKDQELSINIKDSILSLMGSCQIEKLTNTGRSELYYEQDSAIKNIIMQDGDLLELYGRWGIRSNELKLTESVDRGELYLGSGVIDLEEKFKLLNGAEFSSYDSDGRKGASVVFDYRGSGTVSLGTDGPVFMGPEDLAAVPDQKEIPVVSLNLSEHTYFDGNDWYGHTASYESGEYTMLDPYNAYDAGGNKVISYDALQEKYGTEGVIYVYQVFRYKDGRLSVTILNAPDEQIPADNIYLIRKADYTSLHEPAPGAVITTTISSRTGSGTIGGNAKRILTGTGLISKPDDSDKTDSKSDNAKSEDTKKTQDSKSTGTSDSRTVKSDKSVKAGNSGPVYVSNAAGSAVRLVVDMYELNDGKENAEVSPYYVLSAYKDGTALTELEKPAEVVMDYEVPQDFKGKELYAVFAEEDKMSEEMLKAYRAEYNEETGQLSFETAQLGEFVITAHDYDGEEFSPGFYDKLEKTKEIQTLMKLLGKKRS